MSQELFTADEVAQRLGLHVRTVRNYIRDGSLHAVRIGKQYRIARADLETFTGSPATPLERGSADARHNAEASSVVEIDAIGPELASRMSTLLTSAISHNRGGDGRLHLETIYDPARAQLKVVVIGSLTSSSAIFDIINGLVEEQGS